MVMAMSLGQDNQIWIRVITGKQDFSFESLSTKMLLGRLRLSARRDSSQENLKTCASDLQDFFVKNLSTPSVKRDMKKIFGQ